MSIQNRRSIYQLANQLPIQESELIRLLEENCELTPDAFNMKSARLVLVLGKEQEKLWDIVYDSFGGKVSREKLNGFKAAYGTILFFTDRAVVDKLATQYATYKDRFAPWANQAVGMLEFNVWSALRDQGIGANLQHYNPVIDEAVKAHFGLPDSWQLDAQMPFGAILAEPEPKEKENIQERVWVKR